MAFVTFQGSRASNLGAGNVPYLPAAMGGSDTSNTEATVSLASPAGMYSQMNCFISANDRGASTYVFRVNGANGNQNLSIGSSASGQFTDTSNTDTVVAGDLVAYHPIIGSGGTTCFVRSNSIKFAAATNTKTLIGKSSSNNLSTASTTFYNGIFGNVGGSNLAATEAPVQTLIRTAGTLSNLRAYASANARSSTTTIRSRVNGGNGNQTLSIGSGATGAFEDTSNTDTVADGDLINRSATTGTGTGNLTISMHSIVLMTTNKKFQYGVGTDAGLAFNVSTTNYLYPSSGLIAAQTSTTESQEQALALTKMTLSKLNIYISANTVVAGSTLTLRVNGSNGNQSVAIAGLTTGRFEDTSNTDAVLATDLINYQLSVGAGGTSMTIYTIGMLATNTEIGSPYYYGF